jgi:hypothetical protein
VNVETYYSLLKFVPPDARNRMVIAGGYAAAPETAGDIDLWILGDKDGPFDAFKIARYLREDVDCGSTVSRRAGYPNHNLVATVPGISKRWLNYEISERAVTVDRKSVHVLVTDLRTPQDLVDSFDISTHAIALRRGCFTFARFYTSLKVTPVVSRFDTPKQTLARLDKICERYDIKPRAEQRERLEFLAMCEGVVDGLAA